MPKSRPCPKSLIRIGRIMMLCVVALGVTPILAAAQEEESRKPASMLLRFDNDALLGTDRGYTGGATLSWLSGDLVEPENRRSLRWLPGAGSVGSRLSLYLTLGQSLFTPDEIGRSDLVVEDRPYAGLLHFSVGSQLRHARHENAFELLAGIVGPASQAERTQRFLHALIDDVVPRGWQHQLRNEPVLQLSAERRWKAMELRRSEGGLGLDLIPHLGGGAGNLALYSSTGLYARIGWNLPRDFGPGSIRPGGRRWGTSERASNAPTIQLYAGADGKAVLRDLFLDGNTFRDSHSVERTLWTSDGVLGIEMSRGRITLGYEHVYWTRRFETEYRPHTFSSFTVRVN